MFGAVSSAFISGIKAVIVRVEADVANGLPMFDMVGDLSSQVREAKERVRTAVKNSGIDLPVKRTVVNICPANVHKQGSSMDVSIALAVLMGQGIITKECTRETLFVGELSLEGHINRINGTLTVLTEARKEGFKRCIIPMENVSEGSVVEGIEVFGARTFREIVDFLQGEGDLTPVKCRGQETFSAESRKLKEDFSDINGQVVLRRACEIAAAGMHNILMVGPPGSGKTMAARRIPGILPAITTKEALEISSLYSVNGMLPPGRGLIARRPFREVHHTITRTAMIGGLKKAGEVTLADKGVLFLDELPEFDRNVLETLRQPLESGRVMVTKADLREEYPADFMLVAAMNPCKCGYYPDLNKCRCTEHEIRRYMSKVSGPILDRIDICTETPVIEYRDIAGDNNNESSASIRRRVEAAHEIQKARFAGKEYSFNSAMPSADIRKYCKLDETCRAYMEQAFNKLELSARTYNKTLKVARTIADLSGERDICPEHIKEALLFRGLDRKYVAT